MSQSTIVEMQSGRTTQAQAELSAGIKTKMATVFPQNVNGNSPLVAEWCYDYYADFGTWELTNPVHESESYRCIRGGGFAHSASYKPKIFCCVYAEVSISSIDSYSNYFANYWNIREMGIRPARNAE